MSDCQIGRLVARSSGTDGGEPHSHIPLFAHPCSSWAIQATIVTTQLHGLPRCSPMASALVAGRRLMKILTGTLINSSPDGSGLGSGRASSTARLFGLFISLISPSHLSTAVRTLGSHITNIAFVPHLQTSAYLSHKMNYSVPK